MAKKKPGRQWVWAPQKPPKPRVSGDLKAEVEAKASRLIEGFLKPTFLKPPPADRETDYLTDIRTRWHGSFFYFEGLYASPSPKAPSPTYELGFARMEYAGDERFHLAYFRHTGRWWQIHTGLTLDESLQTIQDHGLLHPM